MGKDSYVASHNPQKALTAEDAEDAEDKQQ